MKNKHGLSRDISSEIKKTIRRRCGFGCVICGDAIITYEHFDPPFADAKRHDAAGMTLLCGKHQLETSKGLLSKETIAAANNKPFCKHHIGPRHLFDLGGVRPTLMLGSTDVTNCGACIDVDGQKLIEVAAPDRKSHRWRLSAWFRKATGELSCEIVENELKMNEESFDILQEGSRFTIRSAEAELLVLRLDPPSTLRVLRMEVIRPKGKLIVGKSSLPAWLDTSAAQHQRSPMSLKYHSNSGTEIEFNACTFSFPAGLSIGLGPGIELGSRCTRPGPNA